MRRLILALIPLSLIAGAAAAIAQGTGYGQVTFDNQTSVTGDMYVDETYGCRALGGLMCTTHAAAGTHVAEFRFVDGGVVTTDPFYLQEGDSITIPVTELPAP
jgi:hypothetical protein